MAAMAPERTRALHNFSLPPRLSWGVQRLLRCSKVNSNTSNADEDDGGGARTARIRTESPDSERKRRSDNNNRYYNYRNYGISGGWGGGADQMMVEEESIEVVREELMMDLHKRVDKMKVKMLSDGGGEKEPEETVAAAPAAAAATPETRPWNLRTRRAACREPMICGGKGLRIEEPKPKYGFSPLRTGNRSPRPRNEVGEEAGGGGQGGEKRPRAKFSIALSWQEIEDDFMEIQGKRPPRRPKKRSRYVQKQMDTLFPGLWLSEITPDMYRVNEVVNL